METTYYRTAFHDGSSPGVFCTVENENGLWIWRWDDGAWKQDNKCMDYLMGQNSSEETCQKLTPLQAVEVQRELGVSKPVPLPAPVREDVGLGA